MEQQNGVTARRILIEKMGKNGGHNVYTGYRWTKEYLEKFGGGGAMRIVYGARKC